MNEAHADPIRPGPDNSPLPGGELVFRLPREPNLDRVNRELLDQLAAGLSVPDFFNLSSDDKDSPIPHLSMWCEKLTTVAQAWVLSGSRPANKYLVRLPVDAVRRVGPLDVRWFRALTSGPDGPCLEMRPGWQGHCGVTGLVESTDKIARRALRLKLVDIANKVSCRRLTLAEMSGTPDE